jgi:hypothetical protein
MPLRRAVRTAVVVGGAAHVGAKSAQKGQAGAPPPAAPAAAPAPSAAPAAPDDAAEIQKYAALRDSGAITEEEFTAKKKVILGI